MSNVKDDLMKEIEQKVKRKKEAKERAASRNTVDAYVLDFIKNTEEMLPMASNEIEVNLLTKNAYNNLKCQLMSIDPACKVEIMWHMSEGKAPQVNGALIKWSPHHQKENSCDPELFVDVISLLFK